ENFCKSPDGSGCLQIPYQAASQFNILSPLAYEPSLEVEADNYILAPSAGYSRLNTSPTIDPIDGSTPWSQILNNDVPYSPLPYYFSPISYDVDPRNNLAYNFFTSKSTDYGVEFYLPAYIGWDTTSANTTFVKKVYIKYFYNTPQQPVVFDITGNLGNATECANVINSAHAGYPISSISTDNTWCIVSNAKTQNRPVVIVKGDTSVGNAWKYAGVIIDFKPLENKRGTKVAEPGSALYYLSKLARFELLGIPQITYEPLYCNNNQDNLVPGLFIPALKTRSDFNTAGIGGSYSGDPIARYNDNNSPNTSDPTNYGNYEKKFTFQNKVDHAAVFSSKDFTCCTPLGKAATAESKCCSGKAVLSSDGKSSICKLPKGTDIHVYFNKFVSSEGVGDDQPGGGLTIKGTDTEMDFNAFSGEPKFRDSTYDKLAALGGAYCDGGNVIVGGAFGAFPPEPFSGTYSVLTGNTGNVEDSFPVSIVDSILDFQKSDSNVGKIPYDSGFKWNHHYYCK
ncbi:MAG: hypothetical protein Q7U04_12880, partial [Bacteriovorax sp.]|nr:hypothetical protein [Bacteriovorax sp.]